MPLIVVGADTAVGQAVVAKALRRGGEVRAFVTDPEVAAALRDRGVKVAVGDVSDDSHVGGAAAGCFSAVLVPVAAFDGRPLAFVDDPPAAVAGWVEAVVTSGVTRVLLIDEPHLPAVAEAISSRAPQSAVVPVEDRSPEEIAAQVAELDDAGRL